MPEYIIQKAVGIDKVVKKRRVDLEYMGKHWYAQRKYDGCCAVVTLRDGVATTQSRTGEPVRSFGQIEEELLHQLPGHNITLIGEAWWPGPGQFNLISGDFRRHGRSDRLQFVINDILSNEEFDAGYSGYTYAARQGRLPRMAGVSWSLVSNFTAPDPQAKCNELVDIGGYDGLILRDPHGTWTRGNGTTGEIIKIKRVLSYDLRVIGWEPGKGKHEGRCGALVVDFNGKRLSVGTGLTDQQRDNIAHYYRDDWHGAIVEVEAMDLSSDGLLREPRFKGIRHDKLSPDG